MHPNEIRDFLERAPRKWSFNGSRMASHSHVRYKWLSEMSCGSIDQRINRRAGIPDEWKPWRYPIYKAMARNQRKRLKAMRL